MRPPLALQFVAYYGLCNWNACLSIVVTLSPAASLQMMHDVVHSVLDSGFRSCVSSRCAAHTLKKHSGRPTVSLRMKLGFGELGHHVIAMLWTHSSANVNSHSAECYASFKNSAQVDCTRGARNNAAQKYCAVLPRRQ